LGAVSYPTWPIRTAEVQGDLRQLLRDHIAPLHLDVFRIDKEVGRNLSLDTSIPHSPANANSISKSGCVQIWGQVIQVSILSPVEGCDFAANLCKPAFFDRLRMLVPLKMNAPSKSQLNQGQRYLVTVQLDAESLPFD
jgi:hypothetical protein